MFKELDPLLHGQLRLAIVSILISMESADFTFLKEKTGASSGNISVQLDKLEKAKYIAIKKSFKGKRPNTSVYITKKGIQAFEEYVKALKEYINNNNLK